jgi:hypothetical protein
MPLKKAHQLRPAALHLSTIQKTSVKLAASVLCGSRRDARIISMPSYMGGQFKSILLTIEIWNVSNVEMSKFIF